MRTYLIEPQLLFVPFLTRVLTNAGLAIVAWKDDVDSKDIAAHDPAVIFADVDYFERGASNAICRIREAAKYATIVAFSDTEDSMFEASCYISGASAIVSKRVGVDVAVRIVRGLVPNRSRVRAVTT